MSRTTWAALLVLAALISVVVPFVGYSLPTCFGTVPDGQVSPECMAEWQAAMPMFPQRFVYALGVPLSVVVSFLAVVGIAVVIDLARRFRRNAHVTLRDAD